MIDRKKDFPVFWVCRVSLVKIDLILCAIDEWEVAMGGTYL